MEPINYEQWKTESEHVLDFSTWKQSDIIELYFERMDQVMSKEGFN